MQSLNRRPTVLVIGATGTQGAGVARHLLADGRWTVRAFTRNPHSSAARTLRDAGVEIAGGDLDTPARLRDAMAGCHGVYGVASHSEQWARELRHARTIVDTAAATGVRHLVLRTRADHEHPGHGNSHGEHAISPSELEAAVVQYTRTRGVPATFVRVALHYEHLIDRFRDAARAVVRDDRRHDARGDVRLAAVSSEDVGGIVAALFARRDELVGRVVGAVGDERACSEYADALGRALGRRVAYAQLAREGEVGLDRAADLAESRRLFSRLRPFEQWARDHAREIAPLLASEVPDAVSAAA